MKATTLNNHTRGTARVQPGGEAGESGGGCGELRRYNKSEEVKNHVAPLRPTEPLAYIR